MIYTKTMPCVQAWTVNEIEIARLKDKQQILVEFSKGNFAVGKVITRNTSVFYTPTGAPGKIIKENIILFYNGRATCSLSSDTVKNRELYRSWKKTQNLEKKKKRAEKMRLLRKSAKSTTSTASTTLSP